MADITYQLIKVTDNEVIKLFKLVFNNYTKKVTSHSLNTIVGSNIQNFCTSADTDYLGELNSYLINSCSINFNGFSITYFRGGTSPTKSAYSDSIKFVTTQIQADKDYFIEKEKLDVSAIIFKNLKATDISNQIATEEDIISIHTQTLSRLELLNETLIEKSEEFREKLEKSFIVKKNELEEEYNKNTKAKLDELEVVKNDYATKLKAIDDRDNTHVRRELRENILKEIKERAEKFALTKGTNKLRWPIHIICIMALIIFTTLSVSFAWKVLTFLDKINPDIGSLGFITLGLKQISFTVAMLSTLVFYIRWINKWFEQHSSAEFGIKQFQLDIERASWIVETALEWQDIKGGNIPEILLDNL